MVQSVEVPDVVSCFELAKKSMKTGSKLIESVINTIALMIEEDSSYRAINAAESPPNPYCLLVAVINVA